MPKPIPPEFLRETIEGASGPCVAYSGMGAAIATFNGIPIIVLAASRSALVDVIKEINPDTKIDPAGFHPASIIHDRYIKRKDGDL